MFGIPKSTSSDGGQDAGLEVAADADDGPVEVGHAELAQRLLVGGVGDDARGSGRRRAPAPRRGSASMPRTSLPRRTSSSARERAEPAEADHDDAAVRAACLSSQRWVAPRVVRSGAARSRSASAEASVIGPSRPMNISTISTSCPAARDVGGDAGGQADRAEGGDDLEQHLVQAERGDRQQHQRAEPSPRRRRAAPPSAPAAAIAGGQPAAEHVHASARRGSRPGSRTPSSANVVTLIPPAVPALPPPMNISTSVTSSVVGSNCADVEAVEPGGARHDRRGRARSAACAATSSGPRVPGLRHSVSSHGQRCPHEQERAVGDHGDPGVQRPPRRRRRARRSSSNSTGKPSPPTTTAAQIGQADPRVGDEPDQAVAVQREAGVVERRDRVEHAEVDAPGRTARRTRARTAPVSSATITASIARLTAMTPRDHPADVAQPERLGLRLRGELQSAARAGGPPAARAASASVMMPEPADLDQHQDHHLAERRPVRRGVHDDQPGHAHRRGGGEQRRHQPVRSPLSDDDREHQQNGPDHRGQREPGHDDSPGTTPLHPILPRSRPFGRAY